ncbi:DNA-binding protein [Oenococcus sp. UCMA 17063]|nr:DNA-binding protein [Oenococcus sp. UCMA 17063]
MKIGFIGSGKVGQSLASLMADAGHTIVLSNRHGGSKLQEIIDNLDKQNIQAGDISTAASQELVILAIPFSTLEELDQQLLKNKLVIDATNYFPQRDGELAKFINHQIATSQFVADYFQGSQVVKAFNSFGVIDLPKLTKKNGSSDRIALPVAGDSADKKIVATLINEIGFDSYDAGNLADSFKIQADSNIFGFEGNREALQKLVNSQHD